ncbi:MAG: magnesium-translocating P-type ATPase [Armatimonadota bacterium]
MDEHKFEFWSVSSSGLMDRLHSSASGLSSDEAKDRLALYGSNLLKPRRRSSSIPLFLAQFKSPIIIILLFAAGLSAFLRNLSDALIISIIILFSGLLGFLQERGAMNAVDRLLTLVRIKTTVLRDNNQLEIPIDEIVPGDVVILIAGAAVPGDCAIIESKDLFVNEATLTGETYPVEKSPGVLPVETPLGTRTNSLFMGTHVVSGSATALVVRTGKKTEFGGISEQLRLRQPETEFERGVRGFGFFLLEVTLMLVIAIFAINIYLARPVLDSFLFSLALAVGLTPQLLPAIISVNLAHGARQMAQQQVIVKRLASIENFGSMNVLCSDKTGTITEGVVQLHSVIDIDGKDSEKALLYAYINSSYESGFVNPIDEAIRRSKQLDIDAYHKLDEVPYDFIRKRLSVLAERDGLRIMLTKGAFSNVLNVCSSVELPDGTASDLSSSLNRIDARFRELSTKGFRVLGLAYRSISDTTVIDKDDEHDMVFIGFIVLSDPIKPRIVETIGELERFGVSLKVITGDNRLVASTVGSQIGLTSTSIITGPDLHHISDEALHNRVKYTQIFAEIEPNQKERIILALKRSGYVVGYLGDGINDASALHAADVGISVDSAVDVAKDAADIVLLKKDLSVLANGVREGRVTFANTLKYVFMATSANFGNMFSMAGASLFLPFLPLLPTQILLTNLLTDFPEMAIASDSVDPEIVREPHRWDINFIRSFMMVFGTLSSVFDYFTFGVLLLVLHAGVNQFRTGWFIESVISASVIVLVIRTRKTFYTSRPGRYLIMATVLVVIVTLVLPLTPLGRLFQFTVMPASFLLTVVLIVIIYVAGGELTKRAFYKRVKF